MADELSENQLRELLFSRLRVPPDYRADTSTIQAYVQAARPGKSINPTYWDNVIKEGIVKGDIAWFDDQKTVLCLPHRQTSAWRAEHARDM